MQAVIQTAYGSADVLQVKTVANPEPADKDILIRISASSVTTADSMMRSGTPRYARLFLGLLKPRIAISGTGFSGVVTAIGENVSAYKVGDEVFGESVLGAGTNSEYVCVPEDGVVALKPQSISHAEAAPVCDGAMTSWYMLLILGELQAGEKILINGAAGSLGSAAVQIARRRGAHITGVCSERNRELVKSLGCDEVIDYTTTDVTKGDTRYDLIYDTVGKLGVAKSKRILSTHGRYVSPVLSMSLLVQALWSKISGARRALFSATGLLPAKQRQSMLREISVWLEAGHLKTVVDRRYPLSEIVTAHEYVDTGHKRANVVIVM